MKSPRERYDTDADYKALVDLMTSFIDKLKFTPSEMREAAVMACIHYELNYGFHHYYTAPLNVNAAFKLLEAHRKETEEERLRGKKRDGAEPTPPESGGGK